MGASAKERDTIKKLLEIVRDISEDPKNVEKRKYWVPEAAGARDHWRGKPKARALLPRAPITIEPEVTFWRKILDFDIKDYYQNPVTYLINYLRMLIYRFENFDDETAIGLNIPIWLGVTLESSLFGAETIYTDEDYPWLDRNPVIRCSEDLDKAKPPDFRKSGLMPLVHRYFEEISGLVDDDVTVSFHEWGRSPFGVAFHLRGMEGLLTDMLDNPGFVYRLMRFITDARKNWVTERARFLGCRVEKGNLYNDEINTPTLSPALYEEFILPYEQELSEFHGGILYWHSCGNTTALVRSIARIPNLEMFHVGPWTDGETCMKAFEGRVPLEFCLHPMEDVQGASKDAIEARLLKIATACNGSAYTVRADGLQLLGNLEKDLAKVKDWASVANSILRRS